MGHSFLQPLPLGTSDFATLRVRNQIYVDKTALVYEIASKTEKFFLTRPSRFGKTLLVSTFESLFKYGLREFKGLAIEKLWNDNGTYRVVRLDFSKAKNFQDFDDFVLRLSGVLTAAFKPLGFVYDQNATEPLTTQISFWLKTLPDNSLVLLIDEYDAPLTATLNNADLFNAVRVELSKFYATVKSNDAAVRFFFLTGMTKLNNTSIFSDLNHFTDLSLMPEFGSLLGYTQSELEKYFSNYLDRAVESLGLERHELVDQLKRNYGGFCFEKTAQQTVFCPLSLLKFFSDPANGFENYWYESGGKPTALLQYFQSRALKSPMNFDRENTVDLEELRTSSDVDEISDVALLTQAGYLTIKAVEDDTAFVVCPNLEVKKSMACLCS